MSIGIHLGITEFDETAVEEIGKVFAVNGLPAYQEPEVNDDDMYFTFGGLQCLGRASLDHNSASVFAELGLVAKKHLGKQAPVLAHIADEARAIPIYFIPHAFNNVGPLHNKRADLASSRQLQLELIAIAPHLKIPMDGPSLSDETAQTINDDVDNDLATVWLTLFEASRLCLLNNCGMVLA